MDANGRTSVSAIPARQRTQWDVANDARYLTAFASTGSEATFPVLAAAAHVIGTIDVESDRCNAFSPDDERFLRTCAVVLRPLWQPARRTRHTHQTVDLRQSLAMTPRLVRYSEPAWAALRRARQCRAGFAGLQKPSR
jgi:hypothetical protein